MGADPGNGGVKECDVRLAADGPLDGGAGGHRTVDEYLSCACSSGEPIAALPVCEECGPAGEQGVQHEKPAAGKR